MPLFELYVRLHQPQLSLFFCLFATTVHVQYILNNKYLTFTDRDIQSRQPSLTVLFEFVSPLLLRGPFATVLYKAIGEDRLASPLRSCRLFRCLSCLLPLFFRQKAVVRGNMQTGGLWGTTPKRMGKAKNALQDRCSSVQRGRRDASGEEKAAIVRCLQTFEEKERLAENT